VVALPAGFGTATFVELAGGLDAVVVAARATSATAKVPNRLAIAAAQVRVVTRR
jgi:hypothetical protein